VNRFGPTLILTGAACYSAAMFEKDEKTGMLKPVWEKPRRSRSIQDVASTKGSDDLTEKAYVDKGLAFEDKSGWWWASTVHEVRFTVRLDGRMILVRLPQTWLEACYGAGQLGETLLDAAKADFEPITDQVEAAIAASRFEPDGSVLFAVP
jgi:hypothetical protein